MGGSIKCTNHCVSFSDTRCIVSLLLQLLSALPSKKCNKEFYRFSNVHASLDGRCIQACYYRVDGSENSLSIYMFNKSFVTFLLKNFFFFLRKILEQLEQNMRKKKLFKFRILVKERIRTHIPTINRNNFLKLETTKNLKWTNKVLKLEEQTWSRTTFL